MVNPNETRSGMPREIVPMSASVTMRNGVFRIENTGRERWTHVRLTVNAHFVCDFDNVGQIAPAEYATIGALHCLDRTGKSLDPLTLKPEAAWSRRTCRTTSVGDTPELGTGNKTRYRSCNVNP